MMRALLLLALLLPRLALAVCTVTDSYSATVCADNPVMYWRMGESSGNLADSSGNGRTLTVVGSPTYSQAGGISGGGTSIKSTSSSNYFKRVDGTEFDFGTAAFSAECWLNMVNIQGYSTILSQVGSGGGGTGWVVGGDGSGNTPRLWWNSSLPSLTCSSGSCTDTGSAKWSDVLFVRTGSTGSNTLRIYQRCTDTGQNCYSQRSGYNYYGANAGGVNVNNAADFNLFFASVYGGGAPNHSLQECALYASDISASYPAHFTCGLDGTNCVSAAAPPARRFFQSSIDPRLDPLRRSVATTTLLRRSLPDLQVAEPFFILEKLWARAAPVLGQYDGGAR
jgi:hypothetical protein